MDLDGIAARRLTTQRLVGSSFADVTEAVKQLLGVQSQDFTPAGWSIGMRCDGVDEGRFLEAFDAGEILRTHVLRPTWHLVHPDDLRWLLALTGPRVQQINGHRYRQLELDGDVLARTVGVIVRALEGRARARPELGETLAAHHIDPSGQRLAYIVMHAELEQVVCSGPLAGKQHTYVLLDDRVPPMDGFDRDAALAELAARFFSGHGPATAADLKAWSSLTLADVRTGIEAAGDQLVPVEVGDRRFYLADDSMPAASPSATVLLLQPYDEYVSGALASRDVFDRAAAGTAGGPGFRALVVVDGRIAGSWRRTMRRRRLTVEVATFLPGEPAFVAAVEGEAARLAHYLGVDDVEVVMLPPD